MATDLESLIAGLRGSDLTSLAQALQAMGRPEEEKSDLRDLVGHLADMDNNQVLAIRKVNEVYQFDLLNSPAPKDNAEQNQTDTSGEGRPYFPPSPVHTSNPSLHLPYVDICITPSSLKYGILHIPKEHRGFFPGYNVQFRMDALGTSYVLHLTSGSRNSQVGSNEGRYLTRPKPQNIDPYFALTVPSSTHQNEGCFKRFYENNPQIQGRDTLRIELVDHQYQIYNIAQHIVNPNPNERVNLQDAINGSYSPNPNGNQQLTTTA